jgi:translation initiation factor 2B subunit (eIF-2B alpha/beta/delta family)
MDQSVAAAIERLKADATSGASELLPRAIEILRRVVRLAPDDALEIFRAVGRAQPSMASLWNAALAALREPREPGAFDRFDDRRRRAAEALARCAMDEMRPGGLPRHVVTISYSGSVLACLLALGRSTSVTVSCAEGRPGLEGRLLAERLVQAGIGVEFYSDAALGEALRQDAAHGAIVLVGADAVTPDWALNKIGTRMLAAAAMEDGVPVYVAATRDKFMDARAARLLNVVEHDTHSPWNGAPSGVTPHNTWFERVVLDRVAGVITDAGTLAPGMLEEACRAASADVADEDITWLLAGSGSRSGHET